MADTFESKTTDFNQNRNKKQKINSKIPNYNNQTHTLKKRAPFKPETGNSIIYVNSKSNIKAVLDRCNKLINDNNRNEIIIYCLGAAISKGILISLQLCEKHLAFKIDTKTLSTELIDDLVPAVDEVDYEIQRRTNSALKIRLFRTNLLETAAPSTNQ